MMPGTEKEILGCILKDLPRFSDERGWLVPVWSAQEWDARYFYYNWTYPGYCRDADRWHLHHNHTDRFVVLSGNLLVALSDGKEMQRLPLSSRKPQILHIPPGIYHCVKNNWHKDALLINLPTEVYDPADEGRVPFDELGVGRPW